MLYVYGVHQEELAKLEKWLRSQLSKDQNKSLNISFTQVPNVETNSMALDICYQLKDGNDVTVAERLFLIPIHDDLIGIVTKAPRLVRKYIRMDVRHNNVIWVCKDEEV